MKQSKLDKLLLRMTQEEKLAQVFQLAACCYEEDFVPDFTGPMRDIQVDDTLKKTAGTVIGILEPEQMLRLQKLCASGPNRIPALFMLDVIHGFKTIFPIPLGLASSWDPELMRRTCRIAAREARASGIHATFAPMVDLVRDPRWGRVMESTGEDPYLNSVFAKAAVKGFQGNGVGEKDSLASCVKHLAAYGAAEAGREYNTVDMSRGMLRDMYLDSYRAAVEAGCRLVMTAFNTVERVPATCNKWLLETVLRKEWGFDGVVITDWNSMNELIAHSVAEDGGEAARKALEAGVDIDMMSGHYLFDLGGEIEKDSALQPLLDQAVMRILKLKNEMGLFEDPSRGTDPELARSLCSSEEHRLTALEAAQRSMVLLKNEEILPLKQGCKLTVAGTMAGQRDLLGGWSIMGNPEDGISLIDALKAGGAALSIPGTGWTDKEEVCRLAKQSEVTLLACGEPAEETAEANSKTALRLKAPDMELLRALKAQGSRVVLLVFSGRALVLSDAEPLCSAILQAWFPGTEAGHAIADILFGIEQPEGKLTVSFPYAEGQLPIYYNCFRTGRPKLPEKAGDKYVSHYTDCPNEPLYPFGFGLSYTSYEYSALKLSGSILRPSETLEVRVRVKNTGARAGTEIVQMYVWDTCGSIVRPVKQLRGFTSLKLHPGEEKEAVFTLTEEDLMFWDNEECRKAEPGRFIVMAGPDSQRLLEQEFYFSLT